MKRVRVFESKAVTVASYGNGTMYRVDDHERGVSILFQADDTTADIRRILDSDGRIDDELLEWMSACGSTDQDHDYYREVYAK